MYSNFLLSLSNLCEDNNTESLIRELDHLNYHITSNKYKDNPYEGLIDITNYFKCLLNKTSILDTFLKYEKDKYHTDTLGNLFINDLIDSIYFNRTLSLQRYLEIINNQYDKNICNRIVATDIKIVNKPKQQLGLKQEIFILVCRYDFSYIVNLLHILSYLIITKEYRNGKC